MTASIRILTTASLDSSPSLLIVSPNGSKTLVNCGEGCQRSFLESASAIRIASVNRVCLTHMGHDAVGGLPGMILTSADVLDSVARELQNSKKGGSAGTPSPHQRGNNRKRKGSLISGNDDDDGDVLHLEIVGPEGTNTFLHALRYFMRRDRFKVHTHEGPYDSALNNNKASTSFAAKKKGKKKKKFENGNDEIDFNVQSLAISYDAYDYAESYDVDDPLIQSLPITKQALTYLFVTPPIPGKFLVDKARALNIPKGRLYGQLKAGKSVTFIDATTGEERTVASAEVVAQSSPGVGVAVVYCPTFTVFSKLRKEEAFRAFANGPGRDGDDASEDRVELNVMVHMTPRSIFRNPAYQSWCGSFGSGVDHITLHASETLNDRALEEGDSPFAAAICGGMRRSLVHGGVFPRPFLSTQKSEDEDVQAKCKVGDLSSSQKSEDSDVQATCKVVDLLSSQKSKDNDAQAKCKVGELLTIKGCPMLDYVLMPRSRCGLDESTVQSLYSEKKMNRLRDRVNASGAIQQASAVIDADKVENNNGKGLGELIFTGTGSAVPCKHRNVSGIYLRMNNGNSMLLDVGEGTVGQLLRSWKSLLSSADHQSQIEEYKTRLKGIKAVWISHPHADHHLGLLRLLSERTAVCGSNDPLVLMAPPDMFDFLAEYGAVVPEIKQSYIPVDCYDMIHGRANPLGHKLYEDLGITYCASIPVAHCQRSYAVVVDGTSFGRVAYSGDCRPSNRFAEVARDADLLIHEATFENGMEEDAVMKRHSTVGEAMEIATKMNAGSLVLTHFSQRYPKIPPLNKSHEGKDIPIAFAFDFMRLTPHTIDLAAKLTPALRLLYPQEEGLDDPEQAIGKAQEEGLDDPEQAIEKVTAKELLAVPGMFAAKGVL